MSETIEGTFQLTTNQMETLRTIDRKMTAEFKSAEFDPGKAGDGQGVLLIDSVTCGQHSYFVNFTSLEKIVLINRGDDSKCHHLPQKIEIANGREIFGPLVRLFQNLDTEIVPEPELAPVPPLEPIPLPQGGSPAVVSEGALRSVPTAPGLDPNFHAPPLPDDDEGFPWWGWAGIAAGVVALTGGVVWALTGKKEPEPEPDVRETSTQPVASGTTSGVGQRGGRGDR